MTRLERWAPLTGFVAVVFFVAEALIAGDTPTIDESAGATVRYWQDHIRVQEVSSGFMALSAVAFVWFGASLRSAISEPGHSSDRLGSIAFAGTILISTGLSVYAGIGLALVHSVGDAPASVTQTLTILSRDDMYFLLAVGTSLMVLSTAVAITRTVGWPRWFGWASVLLGVVAVAVVFLGTLVPGLGYLGWLLMVIWIPTTAILMYRRQPLAGVNAP